MSMKTTTGVVVGSLLLFVTSNLFAAGDTNAGKKLYKNSKCMRCHSSAIFKAKSRKIKNLKKLESKVRLCDSKLSTNWFEEDIQDVVAYLNKSFYKFK
jgi:cytochrome c553